MLKKRNLWTRRVFSSALALLIAVTALPVQALAAEDAEEQYFAADDAEELFFAAEEEYAVYEEGAAGKSWGRGDTEDEKKSMVIIDYEGSDPKNPDKINTINFKDGDLKPFTIYNIDSVVTKDGKMALDKDGKAKVARDQLEDWAMIATKLFKAYSTEQGGKYSGPTWSGAGDDWGHYFETENIDKKKIYLKNYLTRTDDFHRETHYGLDPYHVRSVRLSYANNLSAVRDSFISDTIKTAELPNDLIKKQRGNDSEVLSMLKDTKQRDVYYSYVCTYEHNELKNISYYNSYGLVFYDFNIVPVTAPGLYYSNRRYAHCNCKKTDGRR